MFPLASKKNGLTSLVILLIFFIIILISFSTFFSLEATDSPNDDFLIKDEINQLAYDPTQLSVSSVIVSHKPTPKPLRAVYMSSWVAGTKTAREKLLKRLEGTNINTIVIDVKDSSGKVVVKLNAPALEKYESSGNHVLDIVEFVDELHQKGYYVIGHISVFQDNYLTRRRPDLAIRHSETDQIWEDDKGLTWLDPSSSEVWDYAVAVAKEAYMVGFDELNFDYVRFPSDGEISKMRFSYYDSDKKTKSEVIEEFFKYLHSQIKDIGVPTSANVFGLVTYETEDFGIGQVLEKITPYVDYICPMVYPSHYPDGWLGIKYPAKSPYKVIKISLDSAVKRMMAQGLPAEKIRPWLQDFNLGAIYTSSLIKDEIEAVNDAGLDSWMMWDPTNRYTISVYQKNGLK